MFLGISTFALYCPWATDFMERVKLTFHMDIIRGISLFVLWEVSPFIGIKTFTWIILTSSRVKCTLLLCSEITPWATEVDFYASSLLHSVQGCNQWITVLQCPYLHNFSDIPHGWAFEEKESIFCLWAEAKHWRGSCKWFDRLSELGGFGKGGGPSCACGAGSASSWGE